ncbi:hypothetical protein SAMN04487981_12924 [Streptomyces sp. cf386]|nr:hypothetical protein SAMN04487981_12924 [Streptomyces sp. cf386]
MTSWSCRRPDNGPSRPGSWRRGYWNSSGCDCTPRNPASPASLGVSRASISSASTTGRSNRGNGEAGSTCVVGPRPERCACCGTRSARPPPARRPNGPCPPRSPISTPCCGAGQRTSATGTPNQRGRRLRPRTAGHLRQPETQTPRPELDHPVYLRVDHPARGLPPHWKRTLGDGACQSVNDVGKPCAGELHARFEAAGAGNGAEATAPVPDPTKEPMRRGATPTRWDTTAYSSNSRSRRSVSSTSRPWARRPLSRKYTSPRASAAISRSRSSSTPASCASRRRAA